MYILNSKGERLTPNLFKSYGFVYTHDELETAKTAAFHIICRWLGIYFKEKVNVSAIRRKEP